MCKYSEWLIKHYTAQAENGWNEMDLDSIEECPESPFYHSQDFSKLPSESDLQALYKAWTELVNTEMATGKKDLNTFKDVTNQIGAILNKMLSKEDT